MEPSTSKEKAERPKKKHLPKEKACNVKLTEQTMLSALISDVDSLLKRFNEISGTSFYDFGQIIIEKEFPTIFLGRYSTAELVEFSETLLTYVSRFMFSIKEDTAEPPFLYEPSPTDLKKLVMPRKDRLLKERIFGVYLTYCLYFTQPQKSIANIKLSVYQMKELHDFCQRELLSEQCNEALFCINRLVDQHAFMFNPVLVHRFNLAEVGSESLEISDAFTSESLPALKNIERDYTLMQTDLIHTRYIEEKGRHKLPTGMSTVEDSLLLKISEIVSRTEKELEKMY